MAPTPTAVASALHVATSRTRASPRTWPSSRTGTLLPQPRDLRACGCRSQIPAGWVQMWSRDRAGGNAVPCKPAWGWLARGEATWEPSLPSHESRLTFPPGEARWSWRRAVIEFRGRSRNRSRSHFPAERAALPRRWDFVPQSWVLPAPGQLLPTHRGLLKAQGGVNPPAPCMARAHSWG